MIKVSQGCLDEAELAAVREVFAAGYFGHSAPVVEFEQALGKYLGAAHVVAVNTGTSALHLALDAIGIGPGDEVVVPSLTYVACFQAIRQPARGQSPARFIPPRSAWTWRTWSDGSRRARGRSCPSTTPGHPATSIR